MKILAMDYSSNFIKCKSMFGNFYLDFSEENELKFIQQFNCTNIKKEFKTYTYLYYRNSIMDKSFRIKDTKFEDIYIPNNIFSHKSYMDRISDENFKALNDVISVKALGDNSKEIEDIFLILGLPTEEYNEKNKGILKERILCKREFFIGEDITSLNYKILNITDVIIYPSIIGEYFNLILDDFGRYKEELNMNKLNVFVNLGQETTTVLGFEGGKLNTNYVSRFNVGYKTALQYLGMYFKNGYKMNFNYKELDKILNERYLELETEILDLTEVVEAIYCKVVDMIVTKIESLFKDDYYCIEQSIITGGAKETVIGEYLEERLYNSRIVDSSFSSTVDGLYKIGLKNMMNLPKDLTRKAL